MSTPIVIGDYPPTNVEQVVRWECFLDLYNRCWNEDADHPSVRDVLAMTLEDLATMNIGYLKFSSPRWVNRESGQKMKANIAAILNLYYGPRQDAP